MTCNTKRNGEKFHGGASRQSPDPLTAECDLDRVVWFTSEATWETPQAWYSRIQWSVALHSIHPSEESGANQEV